MQSVKLSVTCRTALEAKYDARALKRIDDAIAKWIAADKARGITTIHVALDDAAAMRQFRVSAIPGAPTAEQVKRALDRLVSRLAPDYIVLLGAGDVIPFFEVANPTLSEDADPAVPTDNPYASSQAYDARKRASYLVPDRVVGRIPDLPGSGDAQWLLRSLSVATTWSSRQPKDYRRDLMVCCETWKESGRECAKYLSRATDGVFISPPARARTKGLTARHGARLQMIKLHGAELDPAFYGEYVKEREDPFPEVLRSKALLRRTRKATVVGAMCCFGASVYDPLDPAAAHPGEAPIPSVYLRQGAYGFVGATGTAWVGPETMMCADWIVAAFLKSVLAGASTGRALLESKQDFVRWTEQQGDVMDAAEEKTLLQFVLLGDPSIHPVAAATPAVAATSALLGAVPMRAAAAARRQRRALRHELGATLRATLPDRARVTKATPVDVRKIAAQLAQRAGKRFRFRMQAPRVERVQATIRRPELATTATRGAAMARLGAPTTKTVGRTNYQYYWTARLKLKGAPVERIRMLAVQADPQGNVLRTKLLETSGSGRRTGRGRNAQAGARATAREGGARGGAEGKRR